VTTPNNDSNGHLDGGAKRRVLEKPMNSFNFNNEVVNYDKSNFGVTMFTPKEDIFSNEDFKPTPRRAKKRFVNSKVFIN